MPKSKKRPTKNCGRAVVNFFSKLIQVIAQTSCSLIVTAMSFVIKPVEPTPTSPATTTPIQTTTPDTTTSMLTTLTTPAATTIAPATIFTDIFLSTEAFYTFGISQFLEAMRNFYFAAITPSRTRGAAYALSGVGNLLTTASAIAVITGFPEFLLPLLSIYFGLKSSSEAVFAAPAKATKADKGLHSSSAGLSSIATLATCGAIASAKSANLQISGFSPYLLLGAGAAAGLKTVTEALLNAKNDCCGFDPNDRFCLVDDEEAARIEEENKNIADEKSGLLGKQGASVNTVVDAGKKSESNLLTDDDDDDEKTHQSQRDSHDNNNTNSFQYRSPTKTN
jgi:hypothetical protein